MGEPGSSPIDRLPDQVKHADMKSLSCELELAGYTLKSRLDEWGRKYLYVGTIVNEAPTYYGGRALVVQASYLKSADEDGVLWLKEEPSFTFLTLSKVSEQRL